MTALIRKIHIYAGLFTFAQLIIYGIAGITAAFYAGAERPKVARSIRYVDFTVPASSTDKQVAALVYETLNFPLSRPVPDWFLRHTPDNHLLLDFYNINGIRRVIVLEDERKLRIEEIRNNTPLFLEDIHASTLSDKEAPSLVRVWAAWNEIGMWSLLGFCASGIWLWIASRRNYIWAWVALAAGAGAFATLWAVFR